MSLRAMVGTAWDGGIRVDGWECMAELRRMSPLFCIVDPSLRDFVGHHFAYDDALAVGAREAGFRPVILANRAADPDIASRVDLHRTFRRDIWAGSRLSPRLPQHLRPAADIVLANHAFYRDLTSALGQLHPPSGSVLFAHMVFRHQLPALARFIARQPADGNLSNILLLRYQASFYDNQPCHRAFRLLERAAYEGRRLRLASDSHRLSDDIGALTSLPIEVMPIPHTFDVGEAQPVVGRERVRFVSLGGARDEKGFLEILEAIRILHAEDGLDGLEFVLQSNDALPDVQAAIDAFPAQGIPHVRLLPQALTPEQYADTLASADFVLVPYWREIYASRTSGVFLEAVAAGKPVIATRDTWMSDELERHGAGVVVDDHDPRALAAAIRRAASEQEVLSDRARGSRHNYLALHNPSALIRQVLDGPPASEKKKRERPRVAMFYPWGDFLWRGAGASLRANLVVDTLVPHVDSLRVLQDGAAPPVNRGEVLIESQPVRVRQHVVRRFLRLPLRLLLGGENFGQDLPLWFHIERLLDPKFRTKVADLVRWADVVLLEYSFWGSIVIPECKKAGKTCILTNYDVLSDQVTASPLLRRLTWRMERAALASADQVVTVAPGDQRMLAAAGIQSSLIQNPVDLDRASLSVPGDPKDLLRVLFGVVLPPAPLCLFVGSWFKPNVISAQAVRRIAESVPDAGFVIAGAAAAPERKGNFLALGTVEDSVLTLLYRAADLVLIPLPYGTGSSLKTLEAMGAGVPVLGTSVAFRGVDVESDVECVKEDDLERWPAAVGGLLRDPERRQRIGAAGRRLAERYDHRKVFSAYLPLIGVTPDPVRAADAAHEARKAATDRLMTDLFTRALENHGPGALELAMSLLLDEPVAAPGDREEQLRRALLTSLDRRQFGLAGRLVKAAEEWSNAMDRDACHENTARSNGLGAGPKPS